MSRRHPSADRILRFAAGRIDDERPEFQELEAHLASCADCGPALNEALGAVAAVAEAEARSEPLEPPTARLREAITTAASASRQRAAADALFRTPAWAAALRGHPDRMEPVFLEAVASGAVWHADEAPERTLELVAAARTLGEPFGEPLGRPSAAPAEAFRALLALAEGAARIARREYLPALAALQAGEDAIGVRAESHEFARICLLRAQALRLMNRPDDAAAALEAARQVFLRHTDVVGAAKVLWESANVSWHRGDARLGFRQARRARQLFLEAGDAGSARMLLHVLATCLISMGRTRPARSVLDALQPAARSDSERARLLKKRGKIAALSGHPDEALELLERAAELHGAAGDPHAAGWCLLDAAHAAGRHGQQARQVELASRALALLGAVPGIEADAAVALEELRSAIDRRDAIAEVLAALLRLPAALRTTS